MAPVELGRPVQAHRGPGGLQAPADGGAPQRAGGGLQGLGGGGVPPDHQVGVGAQRGDVVEPADRRRRAAQFGRPARRARRRPSPAGASSVAPTRRTRRKRVADLRVDLPGGLPGRRGGRLRGARSCVHPPSPLRRSSVPPCRGARVTPARVAASSARGLRAGVVTTAASPIPATPAPTSQAPSGRARPRARTASACPGGKSVQRAGPAHHRGVDHVVGRSGTPSSSRRRRSADPIEVGRPPTAERVARARRRTGAQHMPALAGRGREPAPLRGGMGQRLGPTSWPPRRPARRCRAARRPGGGRRATSVHSCDVGGRRASTTPDTPARGSTPAPRRPASRHRQHDRRPQRRPGAVRPSHPRTSAETTARHRRAGADGAARDPRSRRQRRGQRCMPPRQPGDRGPRPLPAGPRGCARRGSASRAAPRRPAGAARRRRQLQAVRTGGVDPAGDAARPVGPGPGRRAGAGPRPSVSPAGRATAAGSTRSTPARRAPPAPITRRTSAAHGRRGCRAAPRPAAGRAAACRTQAPAGFGATTGRPGRVGEQIARRRARAVANDSAPASRSSPRPGARGRAAASASAASSTVARRPPGRAPGRRPTRRRRRRSPRRRRSRRRRPHRRRSADRRAVGAPVIRRRSDAVDELDQAGQHVRVGVRRHPVAEVHHVRRARPRRAREHVRGVRVQGRRPARTAAPDRCCPAAASGRRAGGWPRRAGAGSRRP